jgi:hypothetical protein
VRRQLTVEQGTVLVEKSMRGEERGISYQKHENKTESIGLLCWLKQAAELGGAAYRVQREWW